MPYVRKTTALKMKLRPNPTMHLHQLLARRDCLHLDVFAHIRPGRPDHVLFALELRKGGRDPLLERHLWLVPIGSFDLPRNVTMREGRHYSPDDAVRFNTRSAGEHHAWAREYHHRVLLAEIWRHHHTRRPRFGCVHTSIMCHYWHAYDIPAFPSGFANLYDVCGKGRRRPDGGNRANDRRSPTRRAKDPETVPDNPKGLTAAKNPKSE